MKSFNNASIVFPLLVTGDHKLTSTFFKDEFQSQLTRATREMNVKISLLFANMPLHGLLLKAFLIGKDHLSP